MKKTILALTMAASVLALSACSDKNAGDEVLVKSKAGNVTQSELYNEMKHAQGEKTLQLLVLEKVLDAKYKISDKQVDAIVNDMKEQLGEGFDAYIAQEGHTEESLRKILRINLLQEAALTDGVEVTDKEIEERIKMMNTELNAKHVLVADEETALKVKKELEGGADFAEVAKKYSTEPAAKESGGDLGWFGYGKMVKEFWEGAYALDVNAISEPVQSEHGFHVIKVTEKRNIEAKEMTKEEKEKLTKEIQLEKADPSTIIPKIAKLMKDADVKVEDKDLKSALDVFLVEPEVEKEDKEDKTK
ncbi:peptidylprolyl isomerase [Sporosarcina sp. E16_3]|uniref:peptidylprolyl isomerase n=1 Tax=Sporosarcina sp. E16_3 TaxID=2789293 RepID=UPI001A92F39F|nr:peptidylprolyl isomerase [Sporosarcina sp. E16_3]MBO0602277.1 peptidylprolyl isomerase [Sporosarcina sp. E16_3]